MSILGMVVGRKQNVLREEQKYTIISIRKLTLRQGNNETEGNFEQFIV